MKNKQIINKKAWLRLCLFFALLSVLPVYGSEWRLTLSPDELDQKTAAEVTAMLQKATNDTDQLKLNFFLAVKTKSTDADSALHCLQRVDRLRKTTQFARWDAYIFREKAVAYAFKGEWKKAIENYTTAASIAEARKDIVESARIFRQIGHLYQQQKQPAKAREYYSRSIQFHDPGLSGSFAIKLRKMAYEQGRYAEVISLLKQKITVFKLNNEMLQLSIALANIGFAYVNIKQSDSAAIYLAKAEKIADNLSYNRLLAKIYLHQGLVHQQKEEYSLALKFYSRSLKMTKGLSSLPPLVHVYKQLANVYDSLGKYKIAKAYQDSFIFFSDSMNFLSSAKKIAEVEAKYQIAHKDKEIAEEARKRQLAQAEAKQKTLLLFGAGSLLVALLVLAFFYARQRKTKERQRNAELEQKALRAQMNPHFIFNSLNAIQKLYLENDFEQAGEYMGDFGQLLRKILENSGRALITLHEEMETLDLYMRLEQSRMPGRLEYELNMDDQLDKHHIMVPPLILQPICENAIWHGIVPKEKGKVIINIQQSSNNKLLECSVVDNGVGMGEAGEKPEHNSKGLSLVKQRLGSRGSLKISNLPEGGTQVVLLIPCKI